MDVLSSDRIVVDVGENQVLLDNAPVPVRGKPLLLLVELMRHPGELLSKTHFNRTVWEGRPHSDAVLTTAIKELRGALNDDPRSPWAIETVHGKGYRFLPEVREQVPPPPLEAPAPETQPDAGRSRIGIGVGIGVSLLVVAVLLLRWPVPDTEPRIDSIAVLPFDDLSQQSNLAWFAHGITEELLNSLMRISGLDVAARTSATRLANQGATIADIGNTLNVTHVMEGSVRDSDDGTVRVTAQLIRVKDSFHVWSSTWDRRLTSSAALSIQRDVADRLVALMGTTPDLPPAAEQSAVTLPDDALERLLRGRELASRRTLDSVNAGLNLLHQVNNEFPNNVDAHAALALAYIYAAEAGGIPSKTALSKAATYAEDAIARDPNNTTAILAASLAALVRGDALGSLNLAQRAVDLSPGLAEAHQRKGVALMSLGQIEEARAAFKEAVSRDPLSDIALIQYGQTSLRTGHIDEALRVAGENLRWNPQSHLATNLMGEIALQTGDYERALSCLRASDELSPRHSASKFFLSEAYWRINAGVELKARMEATPAAYAAWLIREGNSQAAVQLAETVQNAGIISLTPMDILLWTEQKDQALGWAEKFLAKLGPLQLIERSKMLPDDLISAYRVLKLHNHPQAGRMSELLASRFNRAPPKDVALFSELYVGLTWHALQNNHQQTLAWLSAVQTAGLILPELSVDPVFEPFRQLPEVMQSIEQMDKRAAVVRDNLQERTSC